jgi:hypothetical protein
MPCQVRCDASGGMPAAGGGGPGADHGQRFLAARPQVSGAADPQRVRPCGAEVIQLRRPAWFTRADQPDAVGWVPCQGNARGHAWQLGSPSR